MSAYLYVARMHCHSTLVIYWLKNMTSKIREAKKARHTRKKDLEKVVRILRKAEIN